jgi:hypothetical protein
MFTRAVITLVTTFNKLVHWLPGRTKRTLFSYNFGRGGDYSLFRKLLETL